jgi:hypothetical protein
LLSRADKAFAVYQYSSWFSEQLDNAGFLLTNFAREPGFSNWIRKLFACDAQPQVFSFIPHNDHISH